MDEVRITCDSIVHDCSEDEILEICCALHFAEERGVCEKEDVFAKLLEMFTKIEKNLEVKDDN